MIVGAHIRPRLKKYMDKNWLLLRRVIMKNNNDMIYVIQKRDEGISLSELLKRRLKLSSRFLRKLKKSNGVYKNDEHVFLNVDGKEGDVIRVVFPEESSYFTPENIPIEAVYEDNDLLFINKQPGIVVHPTKGCVDGTIANGLVHYMNHKNETYKIRFINRLDRDTSGLLMIGKNAVVQEALAEQMRQNKVVKKYITIVEGIIKADEGIIDVPIKKVVGDAARKVLPDGQASLTHYKVLNRLGDQYTVVEVHLKTGRTHQIRVHMSHLGHPVVADTLYGIENTSSMERQALHAAYLSFTHPIHKEKMEVRAELPWDMQNLIDCYEKGF